MKTMLTLLCAQFLAAQTGISQLAWMAGCWEVRSSSGAVSIEEHWMKPAAGLMLGMGRTIRNGKTISTEFLRVSVENGKLTYTAQIGTPNVTPFPVLRMTETEIVFENPNHDFPQRIIYRKEGDALFARIEGLDKGKERHQDFAYKRSACE